MTSPAQMTTSTFWYDLARSCHHMAPVASEVLRTVAQVAAAIDYLNTPAEPAALPQLPEDDDL